MKIALAQINTHIGNFSGNVQKVLAFSEKAKKQGAALVIFPELTLTGYPPKDLLEKPHFIEANLKALQEVAQKISGIEAIVGFADPNPKTEGKALFNAAALMGNGKVLSVQHKKLLPTYDVFDEARYFESGKKSSVWKVGGLRLGLSICEDLWNDEQVLGRKLYPGDPVAELVQQRANVLLNIAASPYQRGKEALRYSLLSKIARKHKLPLIYVNLVGGNDDLIFDGSSFCLNAQGEVTHQLKAFEEDLAIIDTEPLVSKNPPNPPLQRGAGTEDPPTLLKGGWGGFDLDHIYKALILGTRDYFQKNNFKKAVIGLSGGIDSALTAVIAAKACGKENVLGVAMPSPFSSEGSLKDAKALAENLGIAYRVIPIASIYEEYQNSLAWKQETEKGKVDVALQNIQARIRGTLLMALSNREGSLLLSTGNKSEMAVGYCTLYGDMAGGLAVISDLPKTLVYELSWHIRQTEGFIPESTLTKAPSAELAPDQKDQDDLPPYEILDEILKRYIEDNEGLEKIVKAGFSEKVVQKVIQRIDQNEYKRKQAPPGLRITSKAFGYGRRLPITNGFRE